MSESEGGAPAEVRRNVTPTAVEAAAVVMAPDKSSHADVKALQATLHKMAELGGVMRPVEAGGDAHINRRELQQLVETEKPRSDERKRLDAELKKIFEVLDQPTDFDSETLASAGEILGEIPGFLMAIAHDTQLPVEQIKKALKQDAGVIASDAKFQLIVDSITHHLRNPALRKRLEAIVAKIDVPDDAAEDQQKIDELEKSVSRKASVTREIKIIEAELKTLGFSEDDMRELKEQQAEMKAYLDRVPNEFAPIDTKEASIHDSLENVKQAVKDQEDIITANTTGKGLEQQKNTLRQLNLVKDRLDKAEKIAKKLAAATKASAKYGDLQQKNSEISTIKADEEELRKLKRKQEKELGTQKRQLEKAFASSLHSYWNEELLKKAIEAANVRADEKESKDKAEKEKQAGAEEKLRGVFDRYMQLCYFHYKHDNPDSNSVEGWDDEWISENPTLIERGPEAFFDRMINRLDQTRVNVGRKRGAEITDALHAAGIDTTTRPFNIDGLTPDIKRKLGTEIMTKMLGLAMYRKGQATIFDGKRFWNKLRFDKKKAEFIQMQYGQDFWTKAFSYSEELKGTMQIQANEIFGEGVLDISTADKLRENLREMYGKNRLQATGKLFKLLALGGAIAFAAGPFALPALAVGAGHQIARAHRGMMPGNL